MTVRVTNAQREAPVSTVRTARLARRAIRRLRIRTPGRLAITFIGSRRMRALNRQFLRHDWTTDVLSFRYDDDGAAPRNGRAARPGESVIGEILIAPGAARRYAAHHGLPYEEELARYVVHGLLHWLGHRDRTAAERRRMRLMEDRVLAACSRKAGPLPFSISRLKGK